MKKTAIENLEIYNDSFTIANEIWKMIQEWGFFDRDTLGKQFARAVDSIVLNISEGYGRYSLREIRQFSYFARGSFHESQTCLKLARERNLIDHEKYHMLDSKFNILGRKLNNYINYLNLQIANTPNSNPKT